MAWLLAILFFQSLAANGVPPGEAELLARGLDLEEKGRYEQALAVWSQGLTELEAPSLALGRAYIRLVAAQTMDSHYQTASAMHQWGLSAAAVEPNRGALKEELAMLKPLAGSDAANQWEALLERNDPRIYRDLRLFWQRLDPTPATRYNERLVEHWQRIAYARIHFDRQDDPPYGTDDRGRWWVRYGPPARQIEGRLSISHGQVKAECGGTDLPCNGDVMATIVMSLHDQPSYQIWTYPKPNRDMKHNLVVIFADRPQGGFGYVETIDDLIPSRAFQFTDRYTSPSFVSGVKIRPAQDMTPGMMMQWLYYKQLATQEFFFADQFDRMSFEWDRPHAPPAIPNLYIGKYAGAHKEQQHRRETLVNLQRAPEEMSTYEQTFPSIPLAAFQYRLLDEKNRPVVATFLESRPQPAFIGDLAANQDSMVAHAADTATVADLFSHYRLQHGLLLKDPAGQTRAQSKVPAEIVLDSTHNAPSTSVFMVPWKAEAAQVLYAELHNRHPESNPTVDSPFPRSLRGRGKLVVSQPEPLAADPTELQMGDLILGYGMQATPDVDNPFPFVVANDRQIPADQELALHVEVYHLQPAAGGIARFQLFYQIVPVNWLGWTQERKQELSVTLNLESTTGRYTENLAIKTRQLPLGTYVLRMRATDEATGQQVRREIEFDIVK